MLPPRLVRLFPPLAMAGWLALVSPFARAAEIAAPSPSRFVRDGVAVDFSLLAADASPSAAPLAGAPARIRFTLTDPATGRPLPRLHPAAWLSRRATGSSEIRPRTAREKVQELLGGSIFSKAELDLNSFQVLALNDDATITVVDPLFGFGGTKLLAMIPLPGVGEDWALTPDGARLLVTVPAAGRVAVIDAATWKITALLDPGASPRRIAVQPDAHYAWVACDDVVAVLSADGSAVVARLSTGSGPHEIAFSADSRWAFVVTPGAQTLSVIDVRTLKIAKEVALGFAPASAAYSHLAEAVYLTDGVGGEIAVFDAVKHEIVARIAAEPGVGQVKFAPGERFGLVADPARDLVLVFDAATNRIVQRARVERAPEQFAFSSDMVFVLRRGSSSVGMIPLKEIGREGQAVPVAEFAGGEAAFGPRASLGDRIVAAPGEAAVVVANAADKAIYYYMEGMAAPMGNFGNYDRQPRAVLVVDRSLREVAPGVYETAAELPAAGEYDAVFFLDAPRIAHCFDAPIRSNPALASVRSRALAHLEPLARSTLFAHAPARVSFRLVPDAATAAAPADLVLLAVRAPGTWHLRQSVPVAADGTLAFDFTPPGAGIYNFYAESPSLGLALNSAPCLVVRVAEPPPVAP